MNKKISFLIMSDEDKIKWFELAIRFQIDGMIFLSMRSRKNNVGSWVIEDVVKHKILNANMEWEEDLPIAERDEAFMIRTRFEFDTAVSMYEQYKMFAQAS